MDSLGLFVAAAAETAEGGWLDRLDQHSGSATAILAFVLACITAWYALTTRGLLKAAQQERAERQWLRLSEQARRVGGYIVRQPALALGSNGYQPVPGREWILPHLFNASELPVRAVRGILYKVGVEGPVHEFQGLPVLAPGPRPPADPAAEAYDTEMGDEYYIRLIFDDDAALPGRNTTLRSP